MNNSIDDVLEAKRTLSKQHSNNTITSARKDVCVKIGILGKHLILSVPKILRTHRPDTTGHICPDVILDSKKRPEPCTIRTSALK